MRGILLAIGLLIILAGCVSVSEGPQGDTVQKSSVLSDITRYVFEEDGVVCYKYVGAYVGGLSCLPINQTKVKG